MDSGAKISRDRTGIFGLIVVGWNDASEPYGQSNANL